MSAAATRAVVVLREVPTASVLVALHRLLGLGITDIRSRTEAGDPLIDVELFANDHEDVEQTLRTLLTHIEGLEHSVHVCLGDEGPCTQNAWTAEVLRHMLSAAAAVPGREVAIQAEPARELVDAVADATRRAVTDLRAAHQERWCLYVLVTSGEALRPYLSVTVHGEDQWDHADSPYVIVGDEWFATTEPLFTSRGDLHQMSNAAALLEYDVRLASLEAALRRLDQEGLFGMGDEREHVLLLVTAAAPDESDATFARRLNKPGPLLDAWLAEAAEGN